MTRQMLRLGRLAGLSAIVAVLAAVSLVDASAAVNPVWVAPNGGSIAPYVLLLFVAVTVASALLIVNVPLT